VHEQPEPTPAEHERAPDRQQDEQAKRGRDPDNRDGGEPQESEEVDDA